MVLLFNILSIIIKTERSMRLSNYFKKNDIFKYINMPLIFDLRIRQMSLGRPTNLLNKIPKSKFDMNNNNI